MKRLIEIVSWMALFFVLVFAFVEYMKQNQGPLPPIARFNPEIRALENGRFLDVKRRPIEVTWRFLRKTQDGVVAEALSAIDPKKAEPILETLNSIARSRDPETLAVILAGNEQVWKLLKETGLEEDIGQTNSALARSALAHATSQGAAAEDNVQALSKTGLLSAAYVAYLLSD